MESLQVEKLRPKPVVLHTTILFRLLLRAMAPDLVLDVGSMDGSHSRMFRRELPSARVVAFEANPINYQRMLEDPELAAAGVEVLHRAATDRTGSISFYVQPPGANENEAWRQGTSSILQRADEEDRGQQVAVEAVRLDEHVSATASAEAIVLWVDVEGGAFEVLAGAEGVVSQTALIHVEVETEEVWKGQRLKVDVVELLNRYGFIILARGRKELQHDLACVRAELYRAQEGRFRALLWIAKALSLTRKLGGRILGDAVFAMVWRLVPRGWLKTDAGAR